MLKGLYHMASHFSVHFQELKCVCVCVFLGIQISHMNAKTILLLIPECFIKSYLVHSKCSESMEVAYFHLFYVPCVGI